MDKEYELGQIKGNEVKVYVKSKYNIIVMNDPKKRKREPKYEPEYSKFDWLIDILPMSILRKYKVKRPYSVKTYKELIWLKNCLLRLRFCQSEPLCKSSIHRPGEPFGINQVLEATIRFLRNSPCL